MSPPCLTLISVFVVIITADSFSVNVIKAVGDEVSFLPVTFNPPVTSIIWKQKTNGGNDITKVIEWDGEEPDPTLRITVPNPRFKGITSLDEKTGQITIKKLTSEHAGVYIIDINSKEQEQRFSLTVMDVVPVPVITIDSSPNPDVVYLYCNYSAEITWRNSAGDTLTGMKNDKGPVGEFITVKNSKNPDNFYTCTLENAVSEKTSDRVYERDLFKAVDNFIIWTAIVVMSMVFIILFLIIAPCHTFVRDTRLPENDIYNGTTVTTCVTLQMQMHGSSGPINLAFSSKPQRELY